jgi:hypothetical protein
MDMANVLAPKTWCRNRECREGGAVEHGAGDGCTCHPAEAAAGPLPEPRITVLRARAQRLKAFACRACGRAARRMVEWPEMYFRCEECAWANRWARPQAGGG